MPERGRRDVRKQRAILLAGVKHCGKSSIGQALARLRGLPFLDADEELLRRHPAGAECGSVRALYRRLGEADFRRAEAELLGALLREGFCGVLALGGGAVGNSELAPGTLAQLGRLVWLDVPDEVAFQRVLAGGLPPFLADAPDPRAEFARINASRRERLETAAELRFAPDPDRSPEANAAELSMRLLR